jgi:signal transduction histidine kinase
VIRQLPIRLRLTIAFTIVMAVVLTATAFFLHLRLQAELDHNLSQGLHSRLQVVSTLLKQSDNGIEQAVKQGTEQAGEGNGFAQILDRSGRVLGGTEELQHRSLLTPGELRRAASSTSSFDLNSDLADLGSVRLLAGPVETGEHHLVAVMGASLEDRNQALSNLRALLLIGEPVALLLAALAAYGAIGAALRPVEAMRTQAAAISSSDRGKRLPLSPGRDELRRLGETLNEMLDRLEAGMTRERAFVADASHEFRTPLTMLKAELELLKQERPVGAAFDEAVTWAIGDTNRLARLTDDLLALARADRDRLPLSQEAIDIPELLALVARPYRNEVLVAAAAPVDGSAPLTLVADKTRLVQALTNLVDNAVRYGAPPVRLSAIERQGSIELHVTDHGSGFPPAFISRAFERFTQADPSHGSEGTGLGLAIVRTIAESHGGTAHAENSASGGADAWIAIPLDRQGERRVAASSAQPAPSDPRNGGGSQSGGPAERQDGSR